MSDAFSKAERDALVHRAYEMERQLYPRPGEEPLSVREAGMVRERFYASLAEYADRLPRMVLSICPYCDAPLKRAFDPFGLDGWWWHVDLQVSFDEPVPCDHFQVLLGALSLRGRAPAEVRAEVRPGPDVPFVVPALLDLPGMIAVVGRIELMTGDIAYPIGYFSDQEIPPLQLHQPWCRNMYWFKDEDGNSVWSVANDEFDFELPPYVESGDLRWVDLNAPDSGVFPHGDEIFPWSGLEGVRERQQLVAGERDFGGACVGIYQRARGGYETEAQQVDQRTVDLRKHRSGRRVALGRVVQRGLDDRHH